MPSLVYGGVKYLRVRHAIFCKLCKDTIESKGYRHFKYCSCGAIAIDDERVIGDPQHIETRNIYCASVNGKQIWLPEDAYLNIDNKTNQNAREVEVRESQGNSYPFEKVTQGGSSS